MAKNMTVGTPVKTITLFAIPLFIGNVFQQFYNMVDSVVVGNFVGSDALAAVGSCTGAFSLLLSLITGLTGGMSVIVAQYYGAGNQKMVKRTFISSTIVILGVGVGITAVGVVLSRPLLVLLGTPDNILEAAVTYLSILFLGTLANCLYNGMPSLLRALGDSLTPLIILVMASLLNVVLDLWFVIGFGLGVAGVAIATSLAQLISALVSIVYVFRKMPELRFSGKEFHAEKDIVREIVRIGFPAALSSCGVSISVMFMQRAVNAYGSTVMVGYTIGNRAENIGFCLSYSIGLAVGTFCGQNIGAREYERVKKGMRAGCLLALGYTLAVAAVFYLLARPLAGIFTSEAEVIDVAISYIYVSTAFAPVLGLVFVFQNFLRSAGDVTPTVWMSLMEILARSLLAFLFSWLFGYTGIWWATPIGWTLSLALGFFRYRTGKWKEKLTV
ncbi:MAG: MATE family efflux transporter [Clostridiales bacterium]|nr:MATE family efflux transporter [Clostridiales bacterium]